MLDANFTCRSSMHVHHWCNPRLRAMVYLGLTSLKHQKPYVFRTWNTNQSNKSKIKGRCLIWWRSTQQSTGNDSVDLEKISSHDKVQCSLLYRRTWWKETSKRCSSIVQPTGTFDKAMPPEKLCVYAKTILRLHRIAGITLSSEIIIILWLHGYRLLLGPDNVRTQSIHPLAVCPLFLQIINSCVLTHNTLPLTFPLSASSI